MVGRAGHTITFLGGNDPAYIVIHTMGGTIGSADARFKDPASQLSAHYGVGLDGTVVQWVSESDTAYHAGNWDMNLISVGIEHEDGGDSNGPRSEALYEASGRLVRELCLRYGIPISRQWIIGHRDIPSASTTCPDTLDIDRITMMATGTWEPAPPPAPVEQPAQPPPAPVEAAAASTEVGATAPAIPEPGTTPPPEPPPATMGAPSSTVPQPPTRPALAPLSDPLRDIAARIYGDPGRWQEVHEAIRSAASDLPALINMAKNFSTPPPPEPDPQPSATPSAGPMPIAADVPTNPAPPPAPAPQPKLWGGSQGAIFAIQIVYLTILASLAIIYFTNRSMIGLPESLGPISVAVPWFGALGAVLISLEGITQHRRDWDPAFRYWHWARPLIGASFGSISVLIMQAGILAVGTTPSTVPQDVPKNLLYYLVAFVVGYREETFRELIKRLTDIIFTPGPSPSANDPVISSISPQSGPAAGGTVITVLGTGLGKVNSVRFDSTPAKFRVDGDTQVTVTSPPGKAGTQVGVAVGTKGKSVPAGTFIYTGG